MDIKEDYISGVVMLLFAAFQVLMIKSQQAWGPRWFVPESWRINPNAYNYARRLNL